MSHLLFLSSKPNAWPHHAAVASLLRSIADNESNYPSARVLSLDIHSEYAAALSDIATVFSVDPHEGQEPLYIPYWALDSGELLDFLTGGIERERETAFTDKLFEMKVDSHRSFTFQGVAESSITADTPLPFSLKKTLVRSSGF